MCVFAFVLISCAQKPYSAAPANSLQPAQRDSENGAGHRLLELANRERANAGVPPLKWNDRLARSAQKHAGELAEHRGLSHQFADEPALASRISAQGVKWTRVAENVGYAESVDEVHDGWMNSSGHRRNILNPDYNAVGIAVVQRGNRYYGTQNFAFVVPDYDAAEVEAMIAAEINKLRKSKGAGPLARSDSRNMRREACEMQRRGSIKPPPMQGLGSYGIVTYTAPDPRELPGNIKKYAFNLGLKTLRIGACFGPGPENPTGTWWVVALF